ncbi:MAG: recombinase A [Polyangia bacterium]
MAERLAGEAPRLEELVSARYLRRGDIARAPRREPWALDELAGRLVELCSGESPARLSAAFALLRDAQRRGDPAAWITRRCEAFYPPDAVEAGADLDALVVVRAPDAAAELRAADRLIRSGAFGLLVIDLSGGGEREVRQGELSRLLGLARRHDAAVALIGEPGRSLGSLISLRVEARREPVEPHEGQPAYQLAVGALKDKRRGPGWVWREMCRGPDGLR